MEKYTTEIQHDIETGKWGLLIRIPAEWSGDHINFFTPKAYMERFNTKEDAVSFARQEFITNGFTDEQIKNFVDFIIIDNYNYSIK